MYMYIYIYIMYIYIYINSSLSTSHFPLMLHFKTNFQVINQIIATTNSLQRSYFINYLRHSNGISNNYPIITSN